MLRRVAVLALLFATTAARADSVAYSCRGADNVTPTMKGGGCTGFVATDATGKVASRASGFLSAKFEDSDALVFYRDGKRVAHYTMRDLIDRMELVTASTSHYRWLLERSPRTLELGATLELTTTSQRVHTFDVATGKQLSGDDTALWKKCDLMMYTGSEVAKETNGVYTIQRAWLAKGTIPGGTGSKLAFVAAPGLPVAQSGIVLCLVADKQHGWRAIERLSTMWNQLPRR